MSINRTNLAGTGTSSSSLESASGACWTGARLALLLTVTTVLDLALPLVGAGASSAESLLDWSLSSSASTALRLIAVVDFC
jgi:hypothetical protein